MNQEVKTKWVSALRSGNYKQGTACLKDGDKFCCLGVLCDISGVSQWDRGFYCDETAVLPSPVMGYAELNVYNPMVNGDTLSHWNDEKRYDFNQIADLIEKSKL